MHPKGTRTLTTTPYNSIRPLCQFESLPPGQKVRLAMMEKKIDRYDSLFFRIALHSSLVMRCYRWDLVKQWKVRVSIPTPSCLSEGLRCGHKVQLATTEKKMDRYESLFFCIALRSSLVMRCYWWDPVKQWKVRV